jgi:hypothetical protein
LNKTQSPAAYKTTKVEWMKSQCETTKLLEKYGIRDCRFTYMGSENLLVLEFVKREKLDGVDSPIAVRLVVPGVTDKNRNQMYRAVYYYLKSKFEALAFGFIEFAQEFFPHLVLSDGRRTATVYEIMGPQYKEQVLTGGNRPLSLMPPGMEV